jgi:ribonuclease VapC
VIVLDSSILVGIIKGKDDALECLDILARDAVMLGAPTLVETRAWCAMNLEGRTSRWLEAFMDSATVVPFGRAMADIASQAFIAFGRSSGHPARLNFGDCMAYAVATSLGAPLLFKGRDFGHTDVMVHPSSIRV